MLATAFGAASRSQADAAIDRYLLDPSGGVSFLTTRSRTLGPPGADPSGERGQALRRQPHLALLGDAYLRRRHQVRPNDGECLHPPVGAADPNQVRPVAVQDRNLIPV